MSGQFTYPAAQHGATLAESLVAVLVLAVGVIGVAALYSRPELPAEEARFGEQAAVLAETMAERIRAASRGREGFASTIAVVCKPDFDAQQAGAHEHAAQLAACWEDEVEAALPSGYGAIIRDTSTTPISYVVTVSWSAPGAGAASYVIRVSDPASPPVAAQSEGS